MAIYHLSMKPLTRASGRSAVAAAAYRAAERLENERDGLVHDYTKRAGVEHAEIVLPAGVNADWALDRSALWNAAEAAEKRKDARVAREIEVALPHELSPEQRLALTRGFVHDLADRYGVAVDFAVHSPHGATDVRNHHAHLLLTTRKVGPAGLSAKSDLELENRKLQALGLPTSHDQLRAIRVGWEEWANAQLARAGLDLRIDHRSHQACGLEIEPTQHQGVHATQMQRRGKEVTRERLDEATARRNAALIRDKPEQVLELITNEKSVFDRRDIARALHRYVEGAEAFQAALARVMASPALVELQAERRDAPGHVVEPARYSTRAMVAVERAMAQSADRMAAAGGLGVAGWRVAAATEARPQLSGEQRAAVAHVTGPERIAAVVGLAGAGKSTMLAAARDVWEGQGYQVRGAALAGKAAEGLEESAGIGSRTLASWEQSWERGFEQLGPRDVLVIDEAGMVGSKQLSGFVAAADRAGAKLVLVGDPEQLQPIGPGAAFRAVAERVGFVQLEEVRRQREEWQRAASVALGRHRTAEGLRAYAEQGAIRFAESSEQVRDAIVGEVLADMAERPEGSRLVLAHRRADVRALNAAIRAARLARGELADEWVYQTAEGARAFAAGDRLLFRENNRDLGVKNGMLGTVVRAEAGRLEVRLDAARGSGQGRTVAISTADYAAVDHGYAVTIHKAQGATADRAFVLASRTLDRHLTYVAMTRHRDGVQLHAGRDAFRDLADLSARLARGQPKETTLDYERAGYARRRGIELRSETKLAEAAPAEPKRGLFDGLRLSAKAPAPTAMVAPVPPKPDELAKAVERYARAWTDAARMPARGLPVLAHQQVALREAGTALDAARPGAARDLAEALEHQPAATRAMTELQGPARTTRLIAAIEHEARVRQDPGLRAERLVKVWHGLEAQHARLDGWEQAAARDKVEARMRAVAGALRDPQLGPVLRARAGELGIAPGSRLARVLQGPDLDQALRQSLHQGRRQGYGLSR
jgi:Ti-type conjugative transfer relaxase TraA